MTQVEGYAPPPQGYSVQPGGGSVIEYIQPKQVQSGETVISFQMREERGVRELNFSVYDFNNNIVANQMVQNPQPGPFWQGHCPPFRLPMGFYRVMAQAYSLDGNFSQKEISNYEVKMIGQDTTIVNPQATHPPQSSPSGVSFPNVASLLRKR